MSPFEFVCAFYSVVLGVAVAQLMSPKQGGANLPRVAGAPSEMGSLLEIPGYRIPVFQPGFATFRSQPASTIRLQQAIEYSPSGYRPAAQAKVIFDSDQRRNSADQPAVRPERRPVGPKSKGRVDQCFDFACLRKLRLS
ncbi:MAG: hypothetical protein WBV39_00120 [Rudaea sp.]